MILAWLATLALGGPADLQVEIRPLPRAPAAERDPVDDRPVRIVTLDHEVLIDGRYEDAWRSSFRGPAPRSLRHGPPPDPSWGLNAMATPGGLAISLRGVPAGVRSDLAIDPDGSRRGWIRVRIEDGRAVQADCRADPTDAIGMPVQHKWSVYTWDCAREAPALAVSGPQGWEILVPWTTLEPTSDDLRIQWWARTETATASYDKGGAQREYAAGARGIQVEGRPARTDSVSAAPDRARGLTVMTLVARGMEGPETWRWTVSSNGLVLDEGRAVLTPSPTGAATANIDVQVPDVDGISFVAWRDTPEPLRPGAWFLPWSTVRRGSLATPVHDAHLELRTYLRAAEKAVPIEVRTPGGEVLARAEVDLPSGTASLFVSRDPSWPDQVEVRAGDLFQEGWLPSVYVGDR